MKKATKTLLLILCAVVLVVSSVLGTMAYLTSEAEVTNTFAVGKVEIDLNESTLDGTGKTKTNTYHLVPGIPQTKNPIVTIKEKSEACYVRAIVTVAVPGFSTELGDFATFADNFAENYFLTGDDEGFNTEKWEVKATEADADAKTITFTVNYKNEVDKAEEDKDLEVLFDQIQAPGTLTSAQFAELDNMTIDVKAHAIQSAGFANAAAAWDAFPTNP